MIYDLFNEFISWLGYLQRGSVLLQTTVFITALSLEPALQRRLKLNIQKEYLDLIIPAVLLAISCIIILFELPGGFLRYLCAAWLIWRLIDPIKLLLGKRFPNFPSEELDKSIFRPVFLVVFTLTFFQTIGSRESLSIIKLGTVFGVVVTIGKLFSAIVILYAIFAFSSRPASLLALISSQFFGMQPQTRKALELILRYTVIGLGLVSVAYYLGINGTALVAVAGGLSVGIGFGLKEIISNFISSLWLLFEGTVRPGEILMINGDPCTVRKMGLRATQLRRGRDGAELLIPNQNFFTQEAESYTTDETSRRDSVVVGAAYHHEPMEVIALLEELAKKHEKVLQYPPPQAFTIDFADSSINYRLLFWVRNPLEAFGVGSDLRQAIWRSFEDNGIGIPFPQRQVYPMEWPPSKDQTLKMGLPAQQLPAEPSPNSPSEQDKSS
jgi:potassium efflux system protein